MYFIYSPLPLTSRRNSFGNILGWTAASVAVWRRKPRSSMPVSLACSRSIGHPPHDQFGSNIAFFTRRRELTKDWRNKYHHISPRWLNIESNHQGAIAYPWTPQQNERCDRSSRVKNSQMQDTPQYSNPEKRGSQSMRRILSKSQQPHHRFSKGAKAKDCGW